MRLTKLAMLFATALTVGAIGASGASAAIATEAAEWFTGPAANNVATLEEDKVLTAEVGEHPVLGNKFTLRVLVGVEEIDMTATGLECVGCKITNEAVTGKAGKVAIGKGKLKFTNVTVDRPVGCVVRNGSAVGALGVIETKPLVFHADWMHEGKAFIQWLPEAGAVFSTIWVGEGGCAPFAGPFNVTGTLYSESKSATGVFAQTQEIVFSPAIEVTTGAELKFGVKRAELTGTAVLKLGGTFFGIK